MAAIKRKGPPLEAVKSRKKLKADEEHDDFTNFPEERDDVKHNKKFNQSNTTSNKFQSGPKQFKLETSSAEAHAKQRALTQERKANKPNADAIQRSKKIWERLRRKSHVELEERKKLVAELFSIITGRVRDFVFKHDSVRVIQCAIKYANQEPRRQIAQELKSDMRELAQSRYGKFLVAKLVQDRDEQVRDMVTPEFYGHVRSLINHPEASWIVDDIYRQIATPQQKATMLREWYGAEFALFHRKPNSKNAAIVKEDDTADLVKILEVNPEKRRPILQYLLQMINSLIQKKMTGFTMLHDAMLQYFLTLSPGSAEQIEFLEILKGDIDKESEGGGGDLYRNLAFTRSGSRLVCLALAYGSAKDRKTILKCFKDTVEMMALDQHGKMVLVVALDVLDDTKNSSKAIFTELLGQAVTDETQRLDRLEQIVTNLNSRTPILCTLTGTTKWLANDAEKAILDEAHAIRETTSKKDPAARRQELQTYLAEPLLELVAKRADNLIQSSFGCQFITETLLETGGADKSQAMAAVAQSVLGDPKVENHPSQNPAVSRMLKTLIQGGYFDPVAKGVMVVSPPLKFGQVLFPVIEKNLVEWACSDSSFVVVAFLESEDVPKTVSKQVRAILQGGRKKIERAARGEDEMGKKKGEVSKGNVGAKILLEKI